MTEGWAAVPNWIARAADLSPNAKVVYLILQSHAGASGTTTLRLATIAREIGFSKPDTVSKYLVELYEYGVLYWVAQVKGGQRQASVYHPIQERDIETCVKRHSPATERKASAKRTTQTREMGVVTGENPPDSADRTTAGTPSNVPSNGDGVPPETSTQAVIHPRQGVVPPEQGVRTPPARDAEEAPLKKNSSSSSSSLRSEESSSEEETPFQKLVRWPGHKYLAIAGSRWKYLTADKTWELTQKYADEVRAKGWQYSEDGWLKFMEREDEARERRTRGRAYSPDGVPL